ncbi:MAG TPA: hypothetical protein EYN66_11885 [Myxococcales bacterium]|nr:hypothetical protein [Myxococcales bacterium]
MPVDDLSPWGLGQVLRLDQHVVNTFDYARVHGAALLANNISFDAVEATAIESELVDLKGYAMVDWILGEESTLDETFTEKEQLLLAAYLDDGGRLFVSGAEILWDLDEMGSESDKAFAATYLKSRLSADSAETYTLNNGVTFNELYDVAYADVLVAVGDADALWHYDNGGVAAVVYSGEFSVVTAGFPFETVAPFSDQSIEMMNEIMEVLGTGPWHQGGQCEEAPSDPGPETQNQVEPAPGHDAESTAQVIGVGFIVERRTTSCAAAHRPSPIAGPVLLLLLFVLALAYRRKGKRLFAAWQK